MNNSICFEAIVAFDENNGIAKDGVLPWTIKEEMDFFRETTVGHIVVMGINTFLSIPEKHRPLKNRLNIVITSRYDYYSNLYKDKSNNVIFTDNQYFYHQIASCPEIYLEKYKYLNKNKQIDENKNFLLKIFIIGGKQIYMRYLPICSTVWVSKIKGNYECDLFLDDYAKILDDKLMYNCTIYKEYDLFTIYKYNIVSCLYSSNSIS
jgi:dihydrofolate reductase